MYKHGVAFFERRARFEGDRVELTLSARDLNDVLKSLAVLDRGPGQVLGVQYATPQTREERLAGCTLRLGDAHSLADLLTALRGGRVTLHLDNSESVTGLMVGLDASLGAESLAATLVSVLEDTGSQVTALAFSRVQSVEILDERGAADLRFFLETSRANDTKCQVGIRLSPGSHDLWVSYLAPAPAWRVSYRLVADPGRTLLQGWGIFDNQLDEDLNEVGLSLVAGMPISFEYDLATPYVPVRPKVRDESRVAPGPVEFDEDQDEEPLACRMALCEEDRSSGHSPRFADSLRFSARSLEATTAAQAQGRDLGELFEYAIEAPVTVGRGESAMVPIVSENLPTTRALLYNGAKLPDHPVATLMLTNATGLTLERGPVTVLENGTYAGEAILPFTVNGGEAAIPFAVELGVTVREEHDSHREAQGLEIKGHYWIVSEWAVIARAYKVANRTEKPVTVTIEHNRMPGYELSGEAKPRSHTLDAARFEMKVPARGESTLKVQERRLETRREELKGQLKKTLDWYLKSGFLDKEKHRGLSEVLSIWAEMAKKEKRLAQSQERRKEILASQKQIRENMLALGETGRAGEMRNSYLDRLEKSEADLIVNEDEAVALKVDIERLTMEAEKKLVFEN